MFKNILVPIDGSSYSWAAADCAHWLAKRFGAVLTGVNVVDSVSLEGSFIHDISGAMGFEPFLDFSSKMRGILEENGNIMLGEFEAACKKLGIETHRTLASGIVSTEICKAARLSDLIVMGRRGINEAFEYTLLGSVAEAVIRKSSKPVLMVPAEFTSPKNALLAYNGSEHSSKAMHSAAEFCFAMGIELTVLTVSEDGSGDDLLSDAQDYLKPYGTVAHFVSVKGEAHTDIVEYLEENPHDIIFMGVTHHSRLLGAVLGSTTEYIMRSIKGAIFLER